VSTEQDTAEYLAALSDQELLAAINDVLGKRQDKTRTEQEVDDDEFYDSLYPPSRPPRSGPVHHRTEEQQ
jgi:hypothetical protein